MIAMEFDRLRSFHLLSGGGTPAAEFPDQIDEETKKKSGRRMSWNCRGGDHLRQETEEMKAESFYVFIEGKSER